MRFFAQQVLATALVGIASGVAEAVSIRMGYLQLGLADVMTLVLAHCFLGISIGFPIVVGAGILRGVFDRKGSDFPGRIISTLPALGTLCALSFLYAKIRFLPPVYNLKTQLFFLVIIVVGAGVAVAWPRRPWGRRTDLALWGLYAFACVSGALWSSVSLGAPGAVDLPARAAERSREDSPDIYLVVIDTLRPDHLGAYGYARETSPNIDELATGGAVFDRAYSVSNWTRPVVASLLTSTMPLLHGVVSDDRALPPSLPLVTEILSNHGYAVGITGQVNVQPEDGYARGADFIGARKSSVIGRSPLFKKFVFRVFPRVRDLILGSGHHNFLDTPKKIAEAMFAWIESVPEQRPVFAYVHYLGPHAPYLPPLTYARFFSEISPAERLANPPSPNWAGEDWLSPEDRQQMINQYDAEIRLYDHGLGLLLDGLRDSGRLENAVLILTADHGEGFGEHGVWGHGVGMFDEIVRVPLVVWRSTQPEAQQRLQTTVSLLDLAPTILEIAGLPAPETFQGESLLAWLEAESSVERTVFIENPLNDEIGLRTGRWAYFEGWSERAADKYRRWLYRADDRTQAGEISADFPDRTEQFRELASERRALDLAARHEAMAIYLDHERREELKALGYLD